MNRIYVMPESWKETDPRTSGDEPLMEQAEAEQVPRSPHERG